MSTALRRELPYPMTVADFLDWPGDGEGGHYQLIEGEVRAMSPGATDTHGTIQANLVAAIARQLDNANSRCRVVIEPAIIPRLRADINLRVPDLGVTCSPNIAGQIEAPDPVLLIDVLSPGNASDTRANMWAYATIPSVREILLVHSTKVGAELLRRADDGTWPKRAILITQGEMLRLESIGLAVPLLELYARTHLAEG